jgi:hypothetical protein
MSSEEIGIKLAKDLESIEDERIEYRTRIEALKMMNEEYLEIIYYLAEKLSGHKVSAVDVLRARDDTGNYFNVVSIAKPLTDTNMPPIHHIDIRAQF